VLAGWNKPVDQEERCTCREVVKTCGWEAAGVGKPVRRVTVVIALKGNKPREYLDIQSSESLRRNPEVG